MAIYLRTEPVIAAWTDYNGHIGLIHPIHKRGKVKGYLLNQ